MSSIKELFSWIGIILFVFILFIIVFGSIDYIVWSLSRYIPI